MGPEAVRMGLCCLSKEKRKMKEFYFYTPKTTDFGTGKTQKSYNSIIIKNIFIGRIF